MYILYNKNMLGMTFHIQIVLKSKIVYLIFIYVGSTLGYPSTVLVSRVSVSGCHLDTQTLIHHTLCIFPLIFSQIFIIQFGTFS